MRTTIDAGLGAGRYLDLVRIFPLRPVRTDEDLARGIEMIDSLIDLAEIDADEQDYLDVLSDLVAKYEADRHPLPAVTESEMLRHLIEARGITQSQLAADSGIAESTISSILSGKRGMNRGHILVLSRYFKVSPAVFISF